MNPSENVLPSGWTWLRKTAWKGRNRSLNCCDRVEAGMQRYMRPSPTLRQRQNFFAKDFTAFKDYMFHFDSLHFSILFIIPRICIAVCIIARPIQVCFFFIILNTQSWWNRLLYKIPEIKIQIKRNPWNELNEFPSYSRIQRSLTIWVLLASLTLWIGDELISSGKKQSTFINLCGA